MMTSCLPPIKYVVELWKRLGKNQERLPGGQNPNPNPNPSLEYTDSATHSLPTAIIPGRACDLETIRLLVDTATTNYLSPHSSSKPIITTSDYSYGTSTFEHHSASSSSHLVPPSPVRSLSESSESSLDSTLHELAGSGASSFSNGDIPDRSDLESVSALEDALSKARFEWPEGSTRYFLPADAIKSLVTLKSIQEEIEWSNVKLLPDQSLDQIAEKIFKSARRLFCILVMLRKTSSIVEFLTENLNDIDLPFNRDDKTRRSGNFRLCSNKHPNQPVKTMSRWRQKSMKDFCREQWSVVTPTFEKSDSIRHYIFDNNSVFPFTRDEEWDKGQVKEGGFGSVWKIDIHPAHHFFHSKSQSSDTFYPSFALKRLHSTNRDDFESEVKMFKIFSESRQHTHLIKLLATYEFEGQFHLLFPYAKADLRDYWKETPVPEFSEFTVKWFLRQCKGIASALQRIHGYQTTIDAKEALANSQKSPDDNKNSFTDEEERYYGRHGDIKPENILWSDEDTLDEDRFNDQGILLIADFGLMKTHKTLTKNRSLPERPAGSAAYEPPEVAEPRICQAISRAYDIWSLGCVYLEFVTWILCTLKDLERFHEVRSVMLNGSRDVTFYTLIDDGFSGTPRKAIVKESVQEWIKELHHNSQCSEFIHEFLDLIADHMLVADPQERIHCGPLNEKISYMVRKAEENSGYLVSGDSELNGGNGLQNLKDGTPLPKRPSVAKRFDALAGSRTPPQTEWHLPTPPISSRHFHGLVGYL